jgi:Flp pilus assembly protein TadB
VALALIFAAVLLVLVASAVALIRAQRRARSLQIQDRWGLTDDELARFERELPEVAEGISAALPPGTHSRRQIAELAEQSTLRGVLLKRVPRDDDDA